MSVPGRARIDGATGRARMDATTGRALVSSDVSGKNCCCPCASTTTCLFPAMGINSAVDFNAFPYFAQSLQTRVTGGFRRTITDSSGTLSDLEFDFLSPAYLANSQTCNFLVTRNNIQITDHITHSVSTFPSVAEPIAFGNNFIFETPGSTGSSYSLAITGVFGNVGFGADSASTTGISNSSNTVEGETTSIISTLQFQTYAIAETLVEYTGGDLVSGDQWSITIPSSGTTVSAVSAGSSITNQISAIASAWNGNTTASAYATASAHANLPGVLLTSTQANWGTPIAITVATTGSSVLSPVDVVAGAVGVPCDNLSTCFGEVGGALTTVSGVITVTQFPCPVDCSDSSDDDLPTTVTLKIVAAVQYYTSTTEWLQEGTQFVVPMLLSGGMYMPTAGPDVSIDDGPPSHTVIAKLSGLTISQGGDCSWEIAFTLTPTQSGYSGSTPSISMAGNAAASPQGGYTGSIFSIPSSGRPPNVGYSFNAIVV